MYYMERQFRICQDKWGRINNEVKYGIPQCNGYISYHCIGNNWLVAAKRS